MKILKKKIQTIQYIILFFLILFTKNYNANIIVQRLPNIINNNKLPNIINNKNDLSYKIKKIAKKPITIVALSLLSFWGAQKFKNYYDLKKNNINDKIEVIKKKRDDINNKNQEIFDFYEEEEDEIKEYSMTPNEDIAFKIEYVEIYKEYKKNIDKIKNIRDFYGEIDNIDLEVKKKLEDIEIKFSSKVREDKKLREDKNLTVKQIKYQKLLDLFLNLIAKKSNNTSGINEKIKELGIFENYLNLFFIDKKDIKDHAMLKDMIVNIRNSETERLLKVNVYQEEEDFFNKEIEEREIKYKEAYAKSLEDLKFIPDPISPDKKIENPDPKIKDFIKKIDEYKEAIRLKNNIISFHLYSNAIVKEEKLEEEIEKAKKEIPSIKTNQYLDTNLINHVQILKIIKKTLNMPILSKEQIKKKFDDLELIKDYIENTLISHGGIYKEDYVLFLEKKISSNLSELKEKVSKITAKEDDNVDENYDIYTEPVNLNGNDILSRDSDFMKFYFDKFLSVPPIDLLSKESPITDYLITNINTYEKHGLNKIDGSIVTNSVDSPIAGDIAENVHIENGKILTNGYASKLFYFGIYFFWLKQYQSRSNHIGYLDLNVSSWGEKGFYSNLLNSNGAPLNIEGLNLLGESLINCLDNNLIYWSTALLNTFNSFEGINAGGVGHYRALCYDAHKDIFYLLNPLGADGSDGVDFLNKLINFLKKKYPERFKNTKGVCKGVHVQSDYKACGINSAGIYAYAFTHGGMRSVKKLLQAIKNEKIKTINDLLLNKIDALPFDEETKHIFNNFPNRERNKNQIKLEITLLNQSITFLKNGYENLKMILTKEQIKNYKNIVLQGKNYEDLLKTDENFKQLFKDKKSEYKKNINYYLKKIEFLKKEYDGRKNEQILKFIRVLYDEYKVVYPDDEKNIERIYLKLFIQEDENCLEDLFQKLVYTDYKEMEELEKINKLNEYFKEKIINGTIEKEKIINMLEAKIENERIDQWIQDKDKIKILNKYFEEKIINKAIEKEEIINSFKETIAEQIIDKWIEDKKENKNNEEIYNQINSQRAIYQPAIYSPDRKERVDFFKKLIEKIQNP